MKFFFTWSEAALLGKPTAAGHQEILQLREMLPDDPDNLTSCARMNLALQNFPDAVADLRRADDIKPLEDFTALCRLGEHSSNQDPTYAVSICDRVLALTPNTYPMRWEYARVFQQRGACKITLKQFPRALEDLNFAVKLGLDNVTTLKYRATAHAYMGSNDTAFADLDAAHADDPNDATVLSERAAVKVAVGDLVGALDDLNAAEQLGPLSPEDMECRGSIKAALRRIFLDTQILD